MKLSIGIVGLPNVGKSTLFQKLTNNDIVVANYPFATIDPNVGVVEVPDERLQKLSKLSSSEKTIPAVVEFYDIAGLVKGANKGEGLGNQFLSHIRETQAICMVVRCFKNDDVIHVDSNVDPIRDIETITTELVLRDLESVEKRLQKAEKDARSGDKQAKVQFETLKKLQTALSEGTSARELSLPEEHYRELNLLTAKAQLFLLNGVEGDVSDELKTKLGASYVVADLSGDIDLTELIQKAYASLDLISFFTTGEKETRAWTIRNESTAKQAAGAIHTDFEEKFIRAEVINWKKLLEAESWGGAKQKGWIKMEGKEYVVQDGDVMVIHHS